MTNVRWEVGRSETLPLGVDLVLYPEWPWWQFWRPREVRVALDRTSCINFYQTFYKHVSRIMVLEPDE